MTSRHYLPANPVAGYSGFVLYTFHSEDTTLAASCSYWMIPGTFFEDWDNR